MDADQHDDSTNPDVVTQLRHVNVELARIYERADPRDRELVTWVILTLESVTRAIDAQQYRAPAQWPRPAWPARTRP